MNLPNKLSLIRIGLMPVFVLIYYMDFLKINHILATIIFLFAVITDFLDGYIARKYHLITDFGKFLDPIADKIIVGAALFLIVAFVKDFNIIYVICAIVIISREFVVNAFRIIAASKNIVLAADNYGKIKTVFQFIGMLFLLPFPDIDSSFIEYTGIFFLIIGTIFAIISMINYIVENKNVIGNNYE